MTLRELTWLSEPALDRIREGWRQMATVCAIIVNANPFRAKGAKAASPEDFDPYSKRARARAQTPISMDDLQELFCGPRPQPKA